LGNVIWDSTYGVAGVDHGYFIDTTSDGTYIIVGQTSLYYNILFDIYLLKINDDGDTLWTRKIGGPDQSDIGRCVRPTNDGGYIITGWTYSYGIGTPESSNVYLVKTDSLGYVQWERTFGGPGEDRGYSVSQTDDGGYIVAGVYDQGPHTDVYLIKTDSLGYVDWVREVPTRPRQIGLSVHPNPFNEACAITITNYQLPITSVEIYDLRGNLVWQAPPLSSNSFLPEEKEEPMDAQPQSLSPWGERFRERGSVTWRPDPDTPGGVYLVKARAGEQETTKKVVMIR